MNLFMEIVTAIAGRIGDAVTPRRFRKEDKPPAMKDPLHTYIAYEAEKHIGLHEEGGNNKGPQLADIFAADNYDPNGPKPGDDGYPWCAAFICFVVKRAMEEHGGPFTFKRPTTPSAFGYEGWSLAQDDSTNTKKKPHGDIQRGDIVIFSFSHIGIATSSVDKTGHFMTVEGNTNQAGSREGTMVARKRRHIDLVRSRIRFTV